MATVTISDWKPLRKGALRGFCTATLPSGMVIHEISALVSNGKPWCRPPSKPMLDRDGRAMLDRDGRAMLDDAAKRKYSTIIEFQSKEIRDRWSYAVIAALLAAHPGALQDE